MVYILGNNLCPNLEIRQCEEVQISSFSFVDFFGPAKKCQAKRLRATEWTGQGPKKQRCWRVDLRHHHVCQKVLSLENNMNRKINKGALCALILFEYVRVHFIACAVFAERIELNLTQLFCTRGNWVQGHGSWRSTLAPHVQHVRKETNGEEWRGAVRSYREWQLSCCLYSITIHYTKHVQPFWSWCHSLQRLMCSHFGWLHWNPNSSVFCGVPGSPWRRAARGHVIS